MIDLIVSVPLSPEYGMTRDTHMILIIRVALANLIFPLSL